MSENSIADRVALIRQMRRDKDIAKRRLAELAGLPPSTIQEMDADDWNPTLRVLAAVEKALLESAAIAAE